MVDGIWAAAGIRLPQLSPQERTRLAVLRVMLLAADRPGETVTVRRADLAMALAAVDRLTRGPSVDSVTVMNKIGCGAFIAGTMHVHQYGEPTPLPGIPT